MTDTGAAAPPPTTEEAGAGPGAPPTGGRPPPITGEGAEVEVDMEGAAAGASPQGGGNIPPEDTRRSDQEPLKQQSAKQTVFFYKIEILCFCLHILHKF